MADRVPVAADHAHHEGESRLTGAQISAINRFPDDNPNPVMRIDADGHLIYANPASDGVLRALGITVGDRLPADALERIRAAEPARGFVEVVSEGRTWAVWPVEIPDLSFTNLYGQDVSAERAIVKFPDENPNPVMRIDAEGRLLYANPASGGLVAGLGISHGDRLPDEVRTALQARVVEPGDPPVEVDAGGRTYALLPVDVPGFGFINVYGTDITAIRERERLARENERLLLNILPGPIAQRLRDGEPLIADRFDDVTLLFADIVDFTRLSSSLTPDRAGHGPQRRVLGVRRPGGALPAREGQDDRRCLHGGGRPHRARTRSHRPGDVDGARSRAVHRRHRGGAPARASPSGSASTAARSWPA